MEVLGSIEVFVPDFTGQLYAGDEVAYTEAEAHAFGQH